MRSPSYENAVKYMSKKSGISRKKVEYWANTPLSQIPYGERQHARLIKHADKSWQKEILVSEWKQIIGPLLSLIKKTASHYIDISVQALKETVDELLSQMRTLLHQLIDKVAKSIKTFIRDIINWLSDLFYKETILI